MGLSNNVVMPPSREDFYAGESLYEDAPNYEDLLSHVFQLLSNTLFLVIKGALWLMYLS